MKPPSAPIERIIVYTYRVPTDAPEADGTFEWNATELVLVQIEAGGKRGIGYSYTQANAAAALIRELFAPHLRRADAFDIPAHWRTMNRLLRNVGRPGLGLMALSAVDHALWDLKGQLLGTSLVRLWGRLHHGVPAYGSGGFTSYTREQMERQLRSWLEAGLRHVKIKVGTHPARDPDRVRDARTTVGPVVELMVDANGAYDRRQARAAADAFGIFGVTWLEEPVSSDDLEGLRAVREHAPAGMAVAAGEYGWDSRYFSSMLQAQAVDVLQIDTTRCGGFTGFLQAAAIAEAHGIPVSCHCAPALHAHVGAAVLRLRNIEYFHDHVRIEKIFFDGLPALRDGLLHADATQPGLGLVLREADVRGYRIDGD
jgi:L-alanine-DL-glutamate epimerase-like enolase superfamily enzyme